MLLFQTRRVLGDEQDEDQLDELRYLKMNAAVAEAEAIPPPAPDEFFDHMAADLSPRLQEQRADLLHYSKQQRRS